MKSTWLSTTELLYLLAILVLVLIGVTAFYAAWRTWAFHDSLEVSGAQGLMVAAMCGVVYVVSVVTTYLIVAPAKPETE